LKKGVVVEVVQKASPPEAAGMRAGDILLHWKRAAYKGEIETPLDFGWLRIEQGSRGIITIEGLRDGKKRAWSLPGYEPWRILARPNFRKELLSIYVQGEELGRAGKATEAVECWHRIEAIVKDSNIPWLLPWLLQHDGDALFAAKKWDASDEAYKEAILQAIGTKGAFRAELIRIRGAALELRGDPVGAGGYYRLAIAELRRSNKTMTVAEYLVDVGLIAWDLGDYAGAEHDFLEALAIAESNVPASIQAVTALANLGLVWQERGDLDRAEEYYRKALAKEERYFPGAAQLATDLTNFATLIQQRGDPVRCEEYNRKALVISERRDPGSLRSALILGDLADCLLDQGKLSEADATARRDLAITEKVKPNATYIAYSLGIMGKVARVRGRLADAEADFRRAIEIVEKLDSPPPSDTIFYWVGLGHVLRQGGEFARAEECYRHALAIMDKVFPGNWNHSHTLAALASTLHHEGKLQDATDMYQRAFSDLENFSFHIGGVDDDRSRYRAASTEFYRDYSEFLLEQQHPEQAFEVLEASHARTLLEMLSREHINISQGADPSLLEQERTLRQSLNAASTRWMRLLGAGHTDDQLAAADNERAVLLEAYQKVETQIRAKSPTYAALTQPKQMRAHEIQQLLDAKTLLLEYSLGDERSYIWAVSDTSLAAYPLPKRSEIENLVRTLYRLLNTRAMIKTGETELQREVRWKRADVYYDKAAAQLTQMILAPIGHLLEHKRLVFVADGALQYIPFGALPVPWNPGFTTEGDTKRPLISDHEIVSLPSASVLAELRARKNGQPRPSGEVAVLADPVFDIQDERIVKEQHDGNQGANENARVGRSASLATERLTRSASDVGLSQNGRLHLPRLLYTRREAQAIADVTPQSRRMVAVDFQASRATAVSAKLAQYRIVHFATHGLLNSEHPELSGLVLSMVDKQGKPQDGFLQLQDIYNLRLPVEMVVLSGCQTGLGKEISGEGLIGLTRGFMYAGAQRVVASLWRVNDAATAELMDQFYRAMEKDGLTPAAALRRAQIEMMRQSMWNKPYYWAAFQVQGDWN
jgi:CHAT domain-containing protein/Tfp pilus assembly protein PilF